LTDDAAAAGREPLVVVLDEAYAESSTSLADLRDGYPNLVVVRTASKATPRGPAIGFGVARPEMIARRTRTGRPIHLDRLHHRRHRGAARSDGSTRTSRAVRERTR
jgi:histidinol-phosphate/aromatic aminotransferase/cobyric acid decarboxylase-like protein